MTNESNKAEEQIDFDALNAEGRLVVFSAHAAEVARVIALAMVDQKIIPESVIENTSGSYMARDKETGQVLFYLIGKEAYEHKKMIYSDPPADV